VWRWLDEGAHFYVCGDAQRRKKSKERGGDHRRHESEHQHVAVDDDLIEARHTIARILHNQVGHDFSGYKEKTFMRRVRRRSLSRTVSTTPC